MESAAFVITSTIIVFIQCIIFIAVISYGAKINKIEQLLNKYSDKNNDINNKNNKKQTYKEKSIKNFTKKPQKKRRQPITEVNNSLRDINLRLKKSDDKKPEKIKPNVIKRKNNNHNGKQPKKYPASDNKKPNTPPNTKEKNETLQMQERKTIVRRRNLPENQNPEKQDSNQIKNETSVQETVSENQNRITFGRR